MSKLKAFYSSDFSQSLASASKHAFWVFAFSFFALYAIQSVLLPPSMSSQGLAKGLLAGCGALFALYFFTAAAWFGLVGFLRKVGILKAKKKIRSHENA